MKKLGLFFIILALVGCSKKEKQPSKLPVPAEMETIMDSINFDKDSLISIADLNKDLHVTFDEFLKMKDTLIYVTRRGFVPYWSTKRMYRWDFELPDTIKVAFTRDGVFEDSIKAVRQGVVYDKNGKAYSPAYVVTAMVGDNWTYDINGKFIKFNCVDLPHSGAPHSYHP